jgi:hypothetical protein
MTQQQEAPQQAADLVERTELARAVANAPVPAQQVAPANDDEKPTPGQWLGTNASILSVVERLKAVIDEETETLESRAPIDFDAFSRRKNRGLLELSRAMRVAKDVDADPRVVPCLTGLRTSLVKNQAALRIHLEAVREVSEIIAKSIREIESDGTYSQEGSRQCK